ncbi:MAG: winged helix-turn-helix domain-containing protein [Novosphingobium sp.]
MRAFRWLSIAGIPPAYDLRQCGWNLLPQQSAQPPQENCPILLPHGQSGAHNWLSLLAGNHRRLKHRVLLIGINSAAPRARLLRLGFGDVVSGDASLVEIEARSERIAGRAAMLPRFREVDGLMLDLFARDAFTEGRRIGLHPREFAVLWRLCETPGCPVTKNELLSEVWRLAHAPETNSIAVHVSRLRRKLALAGYDGLVLTAPQGGYLVATFPAHTISRKREITCP